MATKSTESYWNVNAKWIFGILFFVFFSLTLFFYSLALATSKERAIRAVATAAAGAFSKKGMDDPVEVELMRKQVGVSPNHEIHPISGLNITLTAKDLEAKRPRDVRVNFFSKLVEPIYENGVKGLETLANDSGMRTKLQGTLGLVFFFTSKNHVTFLTISVILSVLSLALLALVIKFSEGISKILSAGISLSSVALPVIIFFFSFESIAYWIFDSGLMSEQNPTMANYVAMYSFAYSAPDIFKIYATSFSVGILLVVLFFAIRFKIRNSSV